LTINKKINILGPRISPGVEYNKENIRNIDDEDTFSEICMSDAFLESQDAEYVRITGSLFRNVEMNEVVLNSLDLVDVRFVNCDLSGCRFTKARFDRVEFINCKLMGTIFSDSIFKDVRIETCKGEFAVFGFTEIRNSLFKDSSFVNGNFQSAKLTRTYFDNCELQSVQMSGAKLKGIDFRTSNIESIGIHAEDLAGAIVSPAQAVDFARLLGLVVK